MMASVKRFHDRIGFKNLRLKVFFFLRLVFNFHLLADKHVNYTALFWTSVAVEGRKWDVSQLDTIIKLTFGHALDATTEHYMLTPGLMTMTFLKVLVRRKRLILEL